MYPLCANLVFFQLIPFEVCFLELCNTGIVKTGNIFWGWSFWNFAGFWNKLNGIVRGFLSVGVPASLPWVRFWKSDSGFASSGCHRNKMDRFYSLFHHRKEHIRTWGHLSTDLTPCFEPTSRTSVWFISEAKDETWQNSCEKSSVEKSGNKFPDDPLSKSSCSLVVAENFRVQIYNCPDGMLQLGTCGCFIL